MKLLRIDGDRFDFEFSPVEKELFFHALNLYPLVPESHHRLTKGKQMPGQRENQRLLEETIQSQRDENRKEIATWLDEPERFTRSGEDWRVQFDRDDLEWLLQVMNDIRVGSWIAVGSPEHSQEQPMETDPDSLRNLLRMEIAGSFEMYFLGAANGSWPPETNG